MLFRDRFHKQLSASKQDSLRRLIHHMKYELHLFAVMAIELEFYITSFGAHMNAASIIADMQTELSKAGIAVHSVQQERGRQQFEVSLLPTADLEALSQEAQILPNLLCDIVKIQGGEIDFRAKPYPNDYGSGLHIHIHLQRKRDQNLFTRDSDGNYSKPLLWSLGGMLELLPESMILFAPTVESYSRFTKRDQNAPTTISWGCNNRTVALRLPNKPLDWKHIEHRVAGADADIQLAMIAVLAGACYGMQNKLFPGEAIYGNAADIQYEVPPIPDYTTALNNFENATIIREYIGDELYGELLRRMLLPAAF